MATVLWWVFYYEKYLLVLRIAVLISNAGTGTNLQAIIDAIEKSQLHATIVIVISGDKDAFGIERAKKHNTSIIICEKKDSLEDILNKKYKVDYIILAGWKRIISQSLIKMFPNKILNIHPGLIPDSMNGTIKNPDGSRGLWNRGKLAKKAIQNFFDKKATYAGSTVHLLSNEFDFGPVLARCFEKIKKNDTIETLYSRLKKKENQMYVKSLIHLSQKN